LKRGEGGVLSLAGAPGCSSINLGKGVTCADVKNSAKAVRVKGYM
jgi:hypothetical protein